MAFSWLCPLSYMGMGIVLQRDGDSSEFIMIFVTDFGAHILNCLMVIVCADYVVT